MPGVCPRCLREVYFAEEKLALGKVWHNFCFSCRNCRKLLDSWTVATHSGELYCRNCHNRLFPITSVRNPPPVSPIFPPDDTRNLVVSPCGSLSDCRCRCYCNEERDLTDGRYGEEKLGGSSESLGVKPRIRGGGREDEELEADSPLGAGGAGRGSDIEDSQLDAESFVTTLCDPPLSPTAVSAWYNRHHSASQSTFSRPSSANRPSGRPSSTPASGETSANREANICHFSANRRPGSPCRLNHNHHGHSKSCHRHFCRDLERGDKIVGSHEGGKFVKDYRAGNFVANYRNLLSRLDEALQDSLHPPGRSFLSEASISSEEEIPDDVQECRENQPEDCRLRGGCGCRGGEGGGGGGGGSTSGCCGGSSRTSPTFDRRTPRSPCATRHQPDRSSTIEGACGCSGRGRIGCGVSSGGFKDESTRGCCSEVTDEGVCATKAGFRATGSEFCPPRSPDRCSPDPSNYSACSSVACSPPCSGRKGCCPPAGCRPVRRKTARCDAPCVGDTRSCGGGGCCGGGCRGGCGKPGQVCLPLGPCALPPCRSRPAGSPCLPPRRFSPVKSRCRAPGAPGCGGSSCCRSPSPGGRSAGGGGCASPSRGFPRMDEGIACQPKVGTGCECLGGGMDCQRCGRKVYQAEMQIVSGVPYHNICFSCFCCRKPLETLTYHENCGEIYCKQCYVRNFGPQGYGYAGVLQTPM